MQYRNKKTTQKTRQKFKEIGLRGHTRNGVGSRSSCRFFSWEKIFVNHSHNLAEVIFADILARMRITWRLVQPASRESKHFYLLCKEALDCLHGDFSSIFTCLLSGSWWLLPDAEWGIRHINILLGYGNSYTSRRYTSTEEKFLRALCTNYIKILK